MSDSSLSFSSFRCLLAVLCSSLVSAAAFAQTHLVALRDVPMTLVAEASIEATRQATVATQVSGRIVAVRAEVGDRVAVGQFLMSVDAREAAETVAAAQAQLAQTEAHFQRTQNLFRQKFVSQAALDQAEAALKSARAQAGAAGAGASHATVTAPIAGVVAMRHAELGDLATPGKPLVTVFDPRGLRAVASVPQFRLAEARRAQLARVEFPENALRPWVSGAKVEILPTVDAQSHTATVRIHLAEAEGIMPGMAARVHFVIGTAKKLTVPPRAVLHRGEVSAVYVLKDERPSLRQVRLGEPVGDGEIEVLSGLVSGEMVSLDPVKTGIELKRAAAKK